MKFPREFYIPNGALAVADKQSDAVAYLKTGTSGRPIAVLFSGKRAKPDYHYNFSTEAQREQFVKTFFEGRQKTLARKVEQRKERKATTRSLAVGDVLHTSWGYEQTNVEFFQVTGLIGTKMVELRELSQAREHTGFMQGTCEPVPGKFIGEAIRRYDSGHKTVKVDDVRTAFFGGGNHHWSSYH